MTELAERAGLCRVTVLAPRSRIDLALPTDLTVAELVPMLRELTGEAGGHPTPWCLAAVAGAELPPGATLGGLGVLDGDLLRLRPRAEAPPPPVFDDPVDAVAEAVPSPDRSRAPLVVLPWDGHCRRLTGLLAAGLAMGLAAMLLAATRGAGPAAAPVAAVIGALAGVAALAAARAARSDVAAGSVLAAGAAPVAAAAGFAALPGVPGAGHLLLAGALAAAAAAVGLVLLEAMAPVLVAVVVAAGGCALVAVPAAVGLGGAAGLAAAAAAGAVGMLPLLPRISARLAGLPAPVVPTTPDEMLAADARWRLDSDPTGGDDIGHRSRLAHSWLAGLVAGAAAVAAVGAALAAHVGGPTGAAFGWVAVTVLLLRSRAYATAVASAAPLVAGLAGGTALVVDAAMSGPLPLRLGGALGLLVAAAVAVGPLRRDAQRDGSPVARKAADVLEAVLVVATFPLALWVLDLYHLVQGL